VEQGAEVSGAVISGAAGSVGIENVGVAVETDGSETEPAKKRRKHSSKRAG